MPGKKDVQKIVASNNQPGIPGIVRSKRKKRTDPVVKHLNNVRSGDLVDPELQAWAKQLTHLFDRESTDPVHMPMYENNFPCPSTISVNYAVENVTMTGSNSTLCCWFYPDGTTAETLGVDTEHKLKATNFTSATAAACCIGPNVGTSRLMCAGFYQQGIATAGWITGGVGTASTQIPYQARSNPLEPAAGDEFRTAAFGIRVTFMGKLSDTEGSIMFFAPAEYPEGGESWYSYLSDSSTRRRFFGDGRSQEYYWHPTCDEIPFAGFTTGVTTGGYPSRLALVCDNLAPGDKVMIEVISIQEWTGLGAIPSQVPRTQSPDSTHAVNALVSGRGIINGEKRANKAALVKRVAAHKVVATPLLAALSGYASSAARGVKHAESIVGSGIQLFKGVKAIAGLLE